ncbi:MAG: ABC transporter ATP-binding protein [Chloroflexi bacterium]|nr:ABC transporter ATP-binding protein [Chloroflexota bacterium]
MNSDPPLLRIGGLQTRFFTDDGVVRAVDGVSFEIRRGQVIGVVGESGCGKSVLARSILRIVPPPGRITGGEILFWGDTGEGEPGDPIDLCHLEPNGVQMRSVRGKQIAMIFQEPMTSMSPVHTVGNQLIEMIQLHEAVPKSAARDRAVEMLRMVGIPSPEQRMDEYPFRLSGGMLQRCMIAMALACRPKLLIADEPTTALDVTTQAQILELITRLQDDMGMAMILITHNLGVVAQMAEEIMVMYMGKVVEHAPARSLFQSPAHPYTQELLKAVPRLQREPMQGRLQTIKGSIPPPYTAVPGCRFHPRCPKFVFGNCDRLEPEMVSVGAGHWSRCLLHDRRGLPGEVGVRVNGS